MRVAGGVGDRVGVGLGLALASVVAVELELELAFVAVALHQGYAVAIFCVLLAFGVNVLASPGALLFFCLFRFLLWYGRVGVNGSVAPGFRRCLVVSVFGVFRVNSFWLYL